MYIVPMYFKTSSFTFPQSFQVPEKAISKEADKYLLNEIKGFIKRFPSQKYNKSF